MKPFAYTRATNTDTAIRAAIDPTAKFIAGGTNLIDLMKEGVAQPDRLIDITRLPLAEIVEIRDGVRIGALARNSDAANHPLIRTYYPLLSQAFLAGASPQLRNMATVGGNLLQRTRCYYFTDTNMACNKREPGSGCAAIDGFNRIHAIFGTSENCIATHPSDMCVALMALNATVRVQDTQDSREIPFADFHRLPGDTPHIDTNLRQGELITAVILPDSPYAEHSHYLKVRDRTSYAFALVSVAVGLEMEGDRIQSARIAVGGVAHKPWQASEAEALLENAEATAETFAAAAAATIRDAKTYGHNAFKVEMTQRAIVRALEVAAAGTATSSAIHA